MSARRERTRFLIDLLSPELMESLRQAAERDGMGLGTWLRWLGRGRTIQQTEQKENKMDYQQGKEERQ